MRAADADIDHIANALASVACPLTATDALCEINHLIEHSMHIRQGIHPIPNHHCLAILSDSDMSASEHRVNAVEQSALFSELAEERKRLISDTMFRVVEIKPSSLSSQSLSALWIDGEKLT